MSVAAAGLSVNVETSVAGTESDPEVVTAKLAIQEAATAPDVAKPNKSPAL